MIKLVHKFENMVNTNNLLEAWQEFLNGKRDKQDVKEFQFRLMDNILSLHRDLINLKYRHGGYQRFKINDPKSRIIHKASVRDRLLHHAVYRKLYPFFDKIFIYDSFSCRRNKGTHRALNRFREFSYTVSENNTKQCWVLKCDIKKFFASINQKMLVKVLRKYISDENVVNLLKEIIVSFDSGMPGRGVPLGNLTSQLFANVYMNEFDQFIKHKLRIRYYIRYADDIVIFLQNKQELINIIKPISDFLSNELKLELHPDKIFVRTLSSGADFLGWKNFFDHRILRRITKLRILKGVSKGTNNYAILNSYFGLLQHGNAHKIRERALATILRQNH